jgi:hypothetical protein
VLILTRRESDVARHELLVQALPNQAKFGMGKAKPALLGRVFVLINNTKLYFQLVW